MFTKPYKIKSTTTLKNSEKKQLVQQLQEAFPAAAEEVRALVPPKAACSCVRMVLHSGEAAALYAAGGAPVALETARGLLPALPALWRLPGLLPTITIHAPVLPKLALGAPLFLPGVVISSGGVGFPMFAAGAALAVRTQDNPAAALVGYALMPSGDMLLRTQGSCMDIVCVYGDLLTREPRLARVPRPLVNPHAPSEGDTDALAERLDQLKVAEAPGAAVALEQWPALGASRSAPHVPRLILAPEAPPPPPAEGPQRDNTQHVTPTDTGEDPAVPGQAIPSDMDGLLRWCLLSFIVQRAKHVDLPLKVNLLYKNHLMALCPPGRELDVKRSSYKKIGKFLDAMQQEGLVEVRESEKGVWDVTCVNAAHPAARAHRPPPPAPAPEAPRGVAAEPQEYAPPAIVEVFCVTAAVQPLLQVKKGVALSPTEVRAAVTRHVRAQDLAVGGRVKADATLAKVLDVPQQEYVGWDAVMAGVLGRMTPATLLAHADGATSLLKQRLQPITMAVATRSGNKKVTLVSNLESFGLSPALLARSAQAACGAACGVTRSPGAKADQLMLQGDQTTFVARLLVDKYKLPKKYLDGADKALNKKK